MAIQKKKRMKNVNAFGEELYAPDIDTNEIDIPEFDIGVQDVEAGMNYELFDYDREDNNTDIRYMRPTPSVVPRRCVRYDNAKALVKELKIQKGDRWECILTGSFIFGDFIEAFLTTNMCKAVNMTIGTLSMSKENVDSLYLLMMKGYIDNLRLMVSSYFYSMNRRDIIPYIYQKLDIENRFQLGVAQIHTKTCHFESLGGKKLIIHGSANLRSSGSIEQITIEENPVLYDFYEESYNLLFESYKTINKRIGSRASWAEMEERLVGGAAKPSKT